MPVRLAILALALLTLAGRAATNVPADPEAVLRQLRQTPGNPVYLEQLRAALPAMTNARMREVSLAVYGLGCLINDEPLKAQQARDALAREFPDSTSLPLFRADPLMTACPRCGGAKLAQRGEFCETCKGTRHCPVCGGKGKLKALSGKASCSACNGTGRCRTCEGMGRSKSPCARCGGKGRVLDVSEVRRTSYGLLQQYLFPDGPSRKAGKSDGEPGHRPAD